MKTKILLLCALIFALSGCVKPQHASVDLSTPESTVLGFTRAAAKGDVAAAQSFFLPGGVDYEDIRETLIAQPGTPQYPGRVMMSAVDLSAPMPVISQQETSAGLKVVWKVTFAKAFEIEGHKIEAGTQYDLDATLKKTDSGWLIDNF